MHLIATPLPEAPCEICAASDSGLYLCNDDATEWRLCVPCAREFVRQDLELIRCCRDSWHETFRVPPFTKDDPFGLIQTPADENDCPSCHAWCGIVKEALRAAG